MTADLMPDFSDPAREDLHAWVSPTPLRVLERPFAPEDDLPAWDGDPDDEWARS